MDIKTVISDPKFLALPEQEKAKVLNAIDENFRSLDDQEKAKVVGALSTRNGVKTEPVTIEQAQPVLNTTPVRQPAEMPVEQVPGNVSSLPSINEPVSRDGMQSTLVPGTVADTRNRGIDQEKVREIPGAVKQTVENIPERSREILQDTSGIVRPTLEAGGATAGALAGMSSGPVGMALLGGTGYATGSRMADKYDEWLSGSDGGTVAEEMGKTGEALKTGVTLEMGGMAAVPAVMLPARYVRNLYREFTGGGLGFTKEATKRRAGVALNEARSPGKIYDENIDEAARLERDIVGDFESPLRDFKPTLGQASNDPGIIKMEMARYRGKGDAGTVSLESYAKGQQATRDYATEKIGEGGEGAVIGAVDNKYKEFANKVDDAVSGVQALTRKMSSGQKAREAGGAIRDRAIDRKNLAKLRAGELYDLVPDTRLETGILDDTIKKVRRDFDPELEEASEFPEKIVSGLRKKITDDSGELTDIGFQELRKVRTRVQNKIREETAKGNMAVVRRLNTLKGGIEDTINQMEGADVQARDAFRAASKFYRDIYVDRFKKGTLANVLKKDATGAYRVRNANVASKFFQPGPVGDEVAEDFIKAAGGDDLARSAMRDAVSHEMIDAVTDPAGNVIPKKLNAYIARYEPALRRFGLKDEFSELARAQDMVDQALETKTLFERSAAYKVLQANPDNVVKEAFKGSESNPVRAARDIMKLVKGNDAAESGLKKSIVNHLIEQAETNSVRRGTEEAKLADRIGLAAIKKGFRKYDPVIKALYKNEPEKIKAVNNIRKAFETLERNQSSPLGGGSNTAELITEMVSVAGPALSKRYMAVNAIRVLGRMLGQQANARLEDVVVRAMFDPDMAHGLMYMARGEMLPETFLASIKGQLRGIDMARGHGAALQAQTGVKAVSDLNDFLSGATDNGQ